MSTHVSWAEVFTEAFHMAAEKYKDLEIAERHGTLQWSAHRRDGQLSRYVILSAEPEADDLITLDVTVGVDNGRLFGRHQVMRREYRVEQLEESVVRNAVAEGAQAADRLTAADLNELYPQRPHGPLEPR